MCRKGESIFERKDGRFEGRYIKEYDKNGKAVYGSVYAHTYNECKRKKTEITINKYITKKKQKTNRSTKTLNDLVDIWLSTKLNKIKLSSYTRYYNLIEQHIRNNSIGKMKVYKLNSAIINNYLDSLLKNGRLDGNGGLSKNTVYDISNILRQIIKDNKLDIELMKISNETGKGKSLCNKEKLSLETYLKNSNSSISIGILFSLFLGLREAEVCGIKWENIDLENKIIYVKNIVIIVKTFNEKKKTKLILSTPKTKNSNRILPIPDKLYDILINLNCSINKEYYLLTNTNKFMDPRTFYNHYKRTLNYLKISNYTLHDLRHTFATNCIELGIDPKTLMELLGHSNVTTTLNIYVHSTLDSKRNIVNQL